MNGRRSEKKVLICDALVTHARMEMEKKGTLKSGSKEKVSVCLHALKQISQVFAPWVGIKG